MKQKCLETGISHKKCRLREYNIKKSKLYPLNLKKFLRKINIKLITASNFKDNRTNELINKGVEHEG